MVEYKRYDKPYEDKVLKVFIESFVNYPLFFGGGLIPLVKSNGGNLITVTTNSEKNVDFYINNGFTLVKEETLECNEKSIGNWTFRMDL